jgi:hypothetical protein
MENFSPKDLKARYAILYGIPGDISIDILMKPFLLNKEIVDTAICLDGIDLSSNMLRDLAGKSFEFPTNPDESYIDGSIYLEHAHHPVDVASLNFSKSRDGYLTLILKGVYVFGIGGLYNLGSTPFTLSAAVSSRAV